MASHDVLTAHEARLYRQSTSDGMIDLFFGLSLALFGAAWAWLGTFSVLAVVLPAALVPVAIAARRRFVENRLGYVKWAAPRRKAEQRDWTGLLAAGGLLFVVATSFYLLGNRSAPSTDVLQELAPGIMGWLLAALALALGYAMRAWRFFAYSAVLAVAGGMTALWNAEPGWAILASGLVVAAAGVGLLLRFARENPVPGSE